MDYLLAFKKFFGRMPHEFGDKVIVTNITPIFSNFAKEASKSVHHENGFCQVIEINSDDIGNWNLVKVTPGNNIIDVIKLLCLYVKEIVFVGIAGSLVDEYKLGDVVCPNSYMKNADTSIVGEVIICQTDGLIYDQSFYLNLKEKGVSLVDMECFDVNSICNDKNVKLTYIVQISDEPLKTPFYSAESMPINIGKIKALIGGR